MIPLRLPARSSAQHPFVMRLNAEERGYWLDREQRRTPFDGDLIEVSNMGLSYSGPQGTVELPGAVPDDVDGDVLLVLPGQAAHRLIRATSRHNTFLVTECCDQLCVMCSQPPKRHHTDLLPYFEAAALLAPANMTLGISGGEPLLFKDGLFALLQRVLSERPDLRFHVLSNGQHVYAEDLPRLSELPHKSVVWGIPLYSANAATHDRIVGKVSAFDQLLESLAILARAGASVELRTVLMTANVDHLPRLARFITTHLPFISGWAIMQLENIGFGRQNWSELFFDSSVAFHPIAEALNIARGCGIDASLYNFPRCTVPPPYRDRAPSTISDWKRRYLDVCGGCPEQSLCGGFFEWYPHDRGFSRVGQL